MAIQQKLHSEARPEAHPDAVAAAGDQAAADVDARACRPAEPGGGREPPARGGPDRGPAGRRGSAGHRQGRRAGRRSAPKARPTTGTTTTTSTSSATISTTATGRGRRTEVKELPPIENTLSTGCVADRPPGVAAVAPDRRPDRSREIGEAIIGNLDDDGYLVASVDEIARDGCRGRSTTVERVLRLVQGFDPIGVAARDLQECLTLQLRAPRARRHADRADRHRAPAAAAEPPGSRARAQARA